MSGACFSHANPTPVVRPTLALTSPDALALIDLAPDEPASSPDFVEYLSGNKMPPGAEPFAHCYSGHQFGVYSLQLGDGAAIYLGEVVNSCGVRWDVQLKGAGRTHYSRSADGRKVLRSSLRELLGSEAMHALGIPTTRAAALIMSDTLVARDIHYDGHVIHERASVLTRLAPSFLRFGSFEICRESGPSPGQHEALLAPLLEHVIGLIGLPRASGKAADKEAVRAKAFGELVRSTARLAAAWMCVGFCHGVLNTDNMSVLGLTLDYGPFGFLETYDPDYVCNTTDKAGMYAFHKQPEACKWNCERLAEALEPLIPRAQTQPHLEAFDDVYFEAFASTMRAKLGLKASEAADNELLSSLLDVMERTGADWTVSFRALCHVPLSSASGTGDAAALAPTVEGLVECCATPQQLAAMAMGHSMELGAHSAAPEDVARSEALRHKAEELGRAPASVKRAHDVAHWTAWLQRYVQRLGREDSARDEGAWRAAMKLANPRVVLRNWIALEAIDAAERGDLGTVERVLGVVTRPYEEAADADGERYALPASTIEGRCLS